MHLLYLCNNDGSDPRINKEIRTLSKFYKIDFVGMKSNQAHCFIGPYVRGIHIIPSGRKSIPGLYKYFLLVLKLLCKNRYHSIHIINEPLLILCYPLLWFCKTNIVLDLFDSIFLRMNKSGEKWILLKRIIYALPDCIIVTDQERKNLLPALFQKKTYKLPNYPPRITLEESTRIGGAGLTIMYYGWFGKHRGTALAVKLLNTSEKVRFIMAGWPGDNDSHDLLKHPRVEYFGIITQEMAIRMAAQKADYILCVYNPVNENNIYASPNKIYDAIQANVPLIINGEVKIASWVQKNRLGYILESIEDVNLNLVVEELIKCKGIFTYTHKLKEAFVWEKVEGRLLEAHKYEDIALHQSI